MKNKIYKYIYYSIYIVKSNIGMIFRRILNKITYSPITFIDLFTTIKTSGTNAHIYIGKKSCIRNNSEVFADKGIIKIGDGCFINKNCLIVAHKKIIISNGVTIGPNVCIYDHDHDGNGSYKSDEIIIDRNVWIGANSVICKGVHIGDNSVVGAGSVVVHDIPANATYGGVPAKPLKK